jgi:hypothetical protein
MSLILENGARFYSYGIVTCDRRIGSRGKCYDHYFWRISSIVRDTIGVLLKTNEMTRFAAQIAKKLVQFNFKKISQLFL